MQRHEKEMAIGTPLSGQQGIVSAELCMRLGFEEIRSTYRSCSIIYCNEVWHDQN